MLSDTAVRNAKKKAAPYKLTDGKGLYLEVRPTGAKLWRYRYRIARKENVFAIGAYPEVGLSAARAERDAARTLVKQGVHPAHNRKLDRIRQANEHANTFEAVAREWLASKDWTKAVVSERRRLLERDVFPKIGALPIRQVAPAHILEILKRIDKRSPVAAAQVKRAIAGIFSLAVSTLRADTDPSAPVRGAIKQPKSQNKTALQPAQIGVLLRAVDVYHGQFATKIAFRLMWFTLARPIEVIEAPWVEFDLDGAMWRIPAARMKMAAEHIVPLPRQAVALLVRLHALTGGGVHLFPHRDDRTRPMTDNALRQAVKNMRLPFRYSPHATRTTGSTLLNEMGYRGDVIERQLAHQEKDAVRRTYNQAKYLTERAEMMQAWADFLEGVSAGGEIVPIRKTG